MSQITYVPSTIITTSHLLLSPSTRLTLSTCNSLSHVLSCMANWSSVIRCISFWRGLFSVAILTRFIREELLSDICSSILRMLSSSDLLKLKQKWDSGYFFILFQGRIEESLGLHGMMKILFNEPIKQNDTVCLHLYSRVYPQASFWTVLYDKWVFFIMLFYFIYLL